MERRECEDYCRSGTVQGAELPGMSYTSENILLTAPVADARILKKPVENHSILTVSGIRYAEFYADAGVPVRVHAAVDTGMGCFGTRWNCFGGLQDIYKLKNLQFEGIFHIFPLHLKKIQPDEKKPERFLDAVKVLRRAALTQGYAISPIPARRCGPRRHGRMR